MYRKHLETLLAWKTRSNRKPLVLRGARQVGKTHLVREFAEGEFDYYLEINFDETPRKKDFFLHDDIEKTLQYLSVDSDVPIIPGKTLIFLDEIQSAPEVFAKLRYFYEKKPDIHVLAAGSLLDFMLSEHVFSMPVGRIEYMYMGPMDFMEYLRALGSESLYDFIRSYSAGNDIPEPIHAKLLDHVRTYMTVGGMPAAVREYIQSASFSQCERELSSILDTYRDDFSKYRTKVDPEILKLIFDKAPALVGKKTKYTHISSELKSAHIKKGIHVLEQARVLYRIYPSAGNAVPLKAERKERDFKLLLLDSGLMMRALGLNLLALQQENLLLANAGALAEQFISQQWFNLYESYEEPELYYWKREKQTASAEIDFLFQMDGRIIPVEVKAGTTGSLKSLHVFASEKKAPLAVRYNLQVPNITEVTSRIPGKPVHTFRLLSLPVYLVSETRRLIREVGV